MSLLTPQDLYNGLIKIFLTHELLKDKDVNLCVIANEKAGGFTQEKQSEKNLSILKQYVAIAENKALLPHSMNSELFITLKINHAEELSYEIASKASANKDALTLIVTAGGDGTSSEAQTGLLKWALLSEENAKKVRENIVIYRLPLGTGNDGTDEHNFEDSLKLLNEPLHFANERAVKVSVSGEVSENTIKGSGKNPADYGNVENKSPWYSFNVAGLGLDAFVCYKANDEKSKHPGNVYQLMVDFATLNYNKAFPPEDAEITIYNGDEKIDELKQSFEMITFGTSGHRCFGSGKKILPVEENLAVVRKLDVMTMVLKNGKFTDGSYINTDLAKTYKATKYVINYDHPILCEIDGETHLLMKENFPVTFELTEPLVQIFEADSINYDHGAVRK